MKADLKAKWLAALRSDDYTQGQGFLHAMDDTYCCLGVLCEVAGFEWRDPALEYEEGGVWLTGAGDQSEHLEMSEYVALGLDDTRTDFSGSRAEKLSNMNDHGSDFTEIANWVEENVPVDG